MRVSNLALHNFRNYESTSLTPDPVLNILLGKNAQGKTSILEAIYILATARSWKAGKDAELIKWGAEHSKISAEIIRKQQNDIEVKVVLNRSGKKQIFINTIRQTKLAEMIGQVNVVLIEPYDVDIIRGEPSKRRKFMNLEISQIQPQYCYIIASYRKVLEQRNKLLRDLEHNYPDEGVLEVLNEQLAVYGSQILERRLAFINRISDLSRVIHSQITDGCEELSMKYTSTIELEGASTAAEFADRLREKLKERKREEIRRGVTLIGPQRDDLVLMVNGIDARVYGSQGQQRSIALSLRLAELEVMEENAKEPPIVLLDDVMTDLDEERRAHVFEMTQGRCQTFITAATARVFDDSFIAGGKVFNVVNGQVMGR